MAVETVELELTDEVIEEIIEVERELTMLKQSLEPFCTSLELDCFDIDTFDRMKIESLVEDFYRRDNREWTGLRSHWNMFSTRHARILSLFMMMQLGMFKQEPERLMGLQPQHDEDALPEPSHHLPYIEKRVPSLENTSTMPERDKHARNMQFY